MWDLVSLNNGGFYGFGYQSIRSVDYCTRGDLVGMKMVVVRPNANEGAMMWQVVSEWSIEVADTLLVTTLDVVRM